jgi:hypothetical protein
MVYYVIRPPLANEQRVGEIWMTVENHNSSNLTAEVQVIGNSEICFYINQYFDLFDKELTINRNEAICEDQLKSEIFQMPPNASRTYRADFCWQKIDELEHAIQVTVVNPDDNTPYANHPIPFKPPPEAEHVFCDQRVPSEQLVEVEKPTTNRPETVAPETVAPAPTPVPEICDPMPMQGMIRENIAAYGTCTVGQLGCIGNADELVAAFHRFRQLQDVARQRSPAMNQSSLFWWHRSAYGFYTAQEMLRLGEQNVSQVYDLILAEISHAVALPDQTCQAEIINAYSFYQHDGLGWLYLQEADRRYLAQDYLSAKVLYANAANSIKMDTEFGWNNGIEAKIGMGLSALALGDLENGGKWVQEGLSPLNSPVFPVRQEIRVEMDRRLQSLYMLGSPHIQAEIDKVQREFMTN